MQQAGQISPDGRWIWNGAQWVPYQAPVAPAVPYESAGYRARITSILLMTTIGGFALLTVSAVVVDLFPNPSDNQALLIGLLSALAILAWLGTLIPTIVVFCMWLHRVVRNMPALGAMDLKWSPTRAVVYCFIPILNLFHPVWSVLYAWRGADPSRRWLDRQTLKSIRMPGLIIAWWALWLIGGYVSRAAASSTGTGAMVADLIAGACTIAAAVLAIRVVNNVTARQERKNELISSGQLA